MAIWRAQHYRQNGLREGIDPLLLNRAIQYGDAITGANRNLTPIFTLRHLAFLCGASYPALRAYAGRKNDEAIHPYRLFRIKKRSRPGEPTRLRTICAPAPGLRTAQRFIHDNVLSHLPVHPASIAYSQNTRPVEEIGIHCGCRWLIKLDVQNFFEAISERAVYRVFRDAGYPALVSFEMARLCTRIVPMNRDEGPPVQTPARASRYSIEAYWNWRQGSLPQGAPSSPLLANLCSFRLDTMVADIATEYGMAYTRYADDIALSTTNPDFSRSDVRKVIQRVYSAMRQCDLSPNTAKTVIAPPGTRKVVLGLYVDQGTPRLTREFRSRLEQHLHFCLHPDVGPVAHARKRGFSAVLGFKHHLSRPVKYLM
ncbi:reverse transcriptase family protein [Paraburkholderia sediminicola]|uniref:reverse transcriptase family protein n=1 Tax=Paraburkholderia sediminicola TaxID=458836 RepID=UPI0038B99A5F